MRWRAVRAVVRRDLTVARGSKAVVLPAALVPVVLLVILPAAAGFAALALGPDMLRDLRPLLDALPAGLVDDLPADPGHQAAVLTLTHLLAPLILIVPIMLATVVAADGIAGEKERGTLEGLLLTPISDRELLTAKLLAAWIPSVAIGLVGAVLYAVVGNLVVGVQVGQLILPTAEFAALALWLGPAMAAAGLGAVSLVSARVGTTQEAFQIGGIVVIPVLGLVVSQAVGAVLLSVWLVLAVGAVAFAAAAALLVLGAPSLARTRLGERLS